MSTNQSSPRRARLARRSAAVGSVLAVALLGVAFPASAQVAPTPTLFDLYAVTGSATLPGQTVTVWGYSSDGSNVTAPGGPVITVEEDTPVQIALHNQLSAPTSLVIRGQRMRTDLVGAAAGDTKTYLFTPTEPGTFIYEAGPMNVPGGTQHQVAMGLYGALVVTPASGTAYGSDGGAVVVVGEIDPALNTSANRAGFDMRNFAPKYSLFNGKTYPSTPVLTSAAPGDDIVLRYVNAGLSYHSMSVLGANQRIVADDGHALTHPYSVVAQTVGPGQTIDAVVSVSPDAADGTLLSVFDANLQLRNRGRRPATLTARPTAGGAVGFIQVDGTPAPGDTVGPLASNLSATATTLSATIDDTSTGGSDVAAAQYFVDTPGAAGTGTPMTLTPGPSPVSATATFTNLSPGTHTIYVRGQDSIENWGPPASIVVTSDNQVPRVSGLSLTPNPSNGAVTVAVHATASDIGRGGSNIASASYSVDGGPASSMVVNNQAVTASVDATIPAGLPAGNHDIIVSATDAAGNIGTSAPIVLTIDQTGPAMTGVVASPSATNGAKGFNSSVNAVRVTGSATDDAAVSNIARAEGFFDVVGAPGTGFPFVPTDGSWSSTTESVYADIPLPTVSALGEGPHTIVVRARDAVGNWGTTSPAALMIDKTPPIVSGIALVGPVTPIVATSVQFLVTFSEPVTGVNSGNFTLVPGGGFAGGSITSVTGTGTARTVTVATGFNAGTVGLNLTSPTGVADLAGNALGVAGLPAVGGVYTLRTPPLHFSTTGSSNPPGVAGTADDADVYLWDGLAGAFTREIDVTAITAPLPAGANVDGFDRVDGTHFYVSFTGNVAIPLPGPDLAVQDEDVVYYDAGTWSVFFDGSVRGLPSTDLDAISIVGGTLYFSTDNTAVPPGAGGSGDDADIYRWNGASSYTRMIDASALGWSTANVDGLVWVDSTHLYLTYSSNTTAPGVGAVQDEDVVHLNGSTWSTYFDGTAKGLTSANLDVDAFDIP